MKGGSKVFKKLLNGKVMLILGALYAGVAAYSEAKDRVNIEKRLEALENKATEPEEEKGE